MTLEQLGSHLGKKIKLNLFLTFYLKINARWIDLQNNLGVLNGGPKYLKDRRQVSSTAHPLSPQKRRGTNEYALAP